MSKLTQDTIDSLGRMLESLGYEGQVTITELETATDGYTVADLRRDLAALPGDLTIDLEGCDCVARCAGIDTSEPGLITMERA